MYDAKKLIEASGAPEGREAAEAAGLAAFCDELAEQLKTRAREKTAKNSRGHKSYAEMVNGAVAELVIVAATLRKHVPIGEAGPVECPAVNQLGARCMRTDVHESHTYPPTDPNVIHDGPAGPFVVEPGTSADQVVPRMVCGIADKYVRPLETGTIPDRCLLDPHDRNANHKGSWSSWPWQDDAPAVTAPRSTPEQIVAFLKGETDELGTEPLVFEANDGNTVVTVTMDPDSDDAKKITAGVLTGFSVADKAVWHTPDGPADIEIRSWGPVNDPLPGMEFQTPGGIVQPLPDPFSEPVAPYGGGWSGGAVPVEPNPQPLWFSFNGAPPTSIRTTQVRLGEQCGMAYRLVSRDQVPEVPSWANIGGSALHECAGRYERAVMEGMAPEVLDEATARAWWQHYFALEISVTETESPFARMHWRAAEKGAEGEAWWNEAGPLMVRDYSAWSARMHEEGWSILTVIGEKPFGIVPAMELEMHTSLPGGEVTGHLDQAWYRLGEGDEMEIRVIDLKSGSRMPDDDWQLQAYPWELIQRLIATGMPVDRYTWSAAYYDARNGKLCDIVTPHMNSAEITYRAGSVLRMHETNNYPANPGDTWKAPCYVCAVRYACPIMALRK